MLCLLDKERNSYHNRVGIGFRLYTEVYRIDSVQLQRRADNDHYQISQHDLAVHLVSFVIKAPRGILKPFEYSWPRTRAPMRWSLEGWN